MSNLREKLSAVGVNWVEVMERFVDDEELYESCLLAFMEDDSFSGLELSLLQKDYAAAFDYAHTLKSVAGNLGLSEFFKVICTLVEALRNNRYEAIENHCTAVFAEKEKLLALLSE